MDILDPVPSDSARRGDAAGAAPARPSWQRIGILDNSKTNADALLGRVAELLAERTGAAEIVRCEAGGVIPAADHDAVAASAESS